MELVDLSGFLMVDHTTWVWTSVVHFWFFKLDGEDYGGWVYVLDKVKICGAVGAGGGVYVSAITLSEPILMESRQVK